MFQKNFRIVQTLLPVLIPAFVTVLIFVLTYFFYGRDELLKLRVDTAHAVEQTVSAKLTQDLTISQTAVSELEKAIKTVDARYAAEMQELRIEARKAETQNKILNSELLRVQSEIAKLELSTKKLQKSLELKRDEATTSLAVADFMTLVRPKIDVGCNGDFVYTGSKAKREKYKKYKIVCQIENSGRYPFVVTPGWNDETDTSVFDVEADMTPAGLMQPKQKLSGINILIFKNDFVDKFSGHRRMQLEYKAKTPKFIVDVLLRNVRNKEDRRAIRNNSEYVSARYFDLDFGN